MFRENKKNLKVKTLFPFANKNFNYFTNLNARKWIYLFLTALKRKNWSKLFVFSKKVKRDKNKTEKKTGKDPHPTTDRRDSTKKPKGRFETWQLAQNLLGKTQENHGNK